jgi:hypothetical protein
MGDMRVRLRRPTMTYCIEPGPRCSSGGFWPAAQRGVPAIREDLTTHCHLMLSIRNAIGAGRRLTTQ